MTDLFLAPHNDDETLFGAYTIQRVKPFVVICFRSAKQDAMGISASTREAETHCALAELGGPDWAQCDLLDSASDSAAIDALVDFLMDIEEDVHGLDDFHHVYAPAFEEGGHEQHNLVASVARTLYGDRVRSYLTYKRGSMRSHGREVMPEPGMVAAKMRALACYETQIELPATRPWFMDDTLREYMP